MKAIPVIIVVFSACILFLGLHNMNHLRQYSSCILTDSEQRVPTQTSKDDIVKNVPGTAGSPRDKNRPVWAINKEEKDELSIDTIIHRLAGPKTKWDDPELISVVKRLIDPPRPYVTKFSMPLIQTPQAKVIDAYLKGKKNGFFIECGALDGERSSNSIWFETKRNWTGLLVEMDPSYYMQLRGKNRKAKSINACLSPHNYPLVMPFKEHAMGQGKLDEKGDTSQSKVFNTYCFPLYTILLAMNVTTIDYFSLDVEGMEVPILKTIPFDKLDIKTFSVEYVHGKKGGKEYTDFMKSKGYKVHKKINFVNTAQYLGVNDFIFVKE